MPGHSYHLLIKGIHQTGHLSSNQVQNAGVAELSVTEIFTGDWDVPRLINRRFREILRVTTPYMELYENFLQDIAEGREDVLRRLIECDSNVIVDLLEESTIDVGRARAC